MNARHSPNLHKVACLHEPLSFVSCFHVSTYSKTNALEIWFLCMHGRLDSPSDHSHNLSFPPFSRFPPMRCLSLLLVAFLAAAASAQQVIPHHQDRPPGPALSPQEAIAKMTGAGGLQGRAGRQRAGPRQPGGDDVRREGPHLDHREPGVSAAASRAGPRPDQGAGRHRRRRQGGQVHDLCRGPQHSQRHRRRPRRRVGRQRPGHPLLSRHRRRRQTRRRAAGDRHRLRPRRHARTAQLASPGVPTASSTASTASSTTAT